MKTIRLQDRQLSVILSALYDALLSSEQYLVGAEVPAEPRPEDRCCQFHLARHARGRETFVALTDKKNLVADTIRLVESAESDPSHYPNPTTVQGDPA